MPTSKQPHPDIILFIRRNTACWLPPFPFQVRDHVQACGLCGPVAPALSHLFDAGQMVMPAPVAGTQGRCGVLVKPPMHLPKRFA
jgi:hypothetical protein